MTKMENIIETIWKDIPGYEHYQIGISGLVRKIYGLKSKRFRKERVKTKILKTRINNFGYIEVRLWNGRKPSTRFIHKLLGQAFIPNIQNKTQINHKNGIKYDNRLENLEWVTGSENMIHAYQTGLLKKVLKPVIDNCSKTVYKSAREASKQYGINYFTLKNYLNGSRTNPTCLEYKKAA